MDATTATGIQGCGCARITRKDVAQLLLEYLNFFYLDFTGAARALGQCGRQLVGSSSAQIVDNRVHG